ncbi:MAG: addiction module protein [Chthoniobacterales bacterium]
MAAPVQQLMDEMLSLPESTRAFLAEKLLESLDAAADFEISVEWREEIRRRCAELDAGSATTIASDAVFTALHQRLG